GRVVLGREERPAQDLNALICNGPYTGLAARPKRGMIAPIISEPGSEPLRGWEEKQGGQKRWETKGPKSVPALLKRGTHMSKKGLSTSAMSPSPPHVKRARVEACTISTQPPTTSTLAPRVEPETTVARLKKSSLTSFSLRHELRGTSSTAEVVVTPPVGSPTGSPACYSMSPREVLCAFTEEGNGEAIDEVSNAETVVSEVPSPIPA
ncbi:hypothetical protein AMTR_s00034p00178310, partial [Amborella trichopoda]